MGRYEKPHREIHMRFDAYLLKRLDSYIEVLNTVSLKKQTRTQIMEDAVTEYLNRYEKKVNDVAKK